MQSLISALTPWVCPQRFCHTQLFHLSICAQPPLPSTTVLSISLPLSRNCTSKGLKCSCNQATLAHPSLYTWIITLSMCFCFFRLCGAWCVWVWRKRDLIWVLSSATLRVPFRPGSSWCICVTRLRLWRLLSSRENNPSFSLLCRLHLSSQVCEQPWPNLTSSTGRSTCLSSCRMAPPSTGLMR